MAEKSQTAPLVGIIMGSKSDWETMQAAADVLQQFGVPHECRIVSAHRTPDWMCQYAKEAEGRGLAVIIAGAGGAAHLPGMVAAQSVLPVLGVPVQSKALSGLDSLLSMVQMPGGIPVGTLAIGQAGAKNAALLAVRILATTRADLRQKLHAYHEEQAQEVMNAELPKSNAAEMAAKSAKSHKKRTGNH
ncbi:MAG: 5-(carboxyamino)imidazole ribonucleotide mutase [Pirellulaceae bacterium]